MDAVGHPLEGALNVTEPFVLKRDVLLIPCAELSDDVRRKMSFEEGDFTLSRRYGRSLAQVIDGDTAALLALFREPRTLVEAVIENSRALGRDPRARFDELLPHLGTFVDKHVLVPAGSDDDAEIRPRFESGAAIAGWKVVRCVSILEDSEIYQLRNGNDVAALKIARVTTPFLRSVFENETEILRHLAGSAVAPRLLDAGDDEERPYLILEWIAGVDIGVAAAQRRHDRAATIGLCASLAAVYAELHAHGILHSDVHARNVIAGDEVRLIDFGYSRFIDRPPRLGRGGIHFFFEPETAAAQREGLPASSSPAGEQYSVAALLYLLVAGAHYVDFRYDREEMGRQVESEPPLPFAARGLPPWPEVEQILFRALEKDPARRYGSMSELAAHLAEAHAHAVRESLATPIAPEATAFLETILQSYARGGEMFAAGYTAAPRASIANGAAGAAVAMLRIAEARSDPALLALADVWRSRAAALLGRTEAFYDDDELSHRALHDVSPYHTEAGIHALAAMIAAARGDLPSQRRAISSFLDASRRPCPEIDLTLGRGGALLAASMLLSNAGGLPEADALRAFGSQTTADIWNELDARPPIEASPPHTYLGMAHGWAGHIYAALRWSAASGDALPLRLVERLHEHAAMKTPAGRGVYLRIATDQPSVMMHGWCHGSAGQVFLFTLAHQLVRDDEWLRIAELCAWDCWDQPRGTADLCCGTAGRAYALLNFYKHTGDRAWLSRARQLANEAAACAVATSQRRNSLWKGELGVAVLIADLESPENARMPFFE